MLTLIQRIQEIYPFEPLPSVEIKGHSNTIVLKKWIYISNEENNHCDEMKIILSEMTQNNKTLENELRLYITSAEDEYLSNEIHFFDFSDEKIIFNFLSTFITNP